MSVPAPPVPLEDFCAVIYDNALYTYSAGSFLRLKLEPDAKWEELSQGVPVTGGVCVGSTPADADEAGLYIVGGLAPDDQYSGLQKFTYSTEEWKSIALESDVMKRRQWHGAAYLKSSDSILVYAGKVDGVREPASETFTIQAKSPYGIASSPSNASPAESPLLLPWSDTDVVMVGGDPENRRVMLFNAESQWRDSGATLADPISKDASAIKAVLIDGDDGSKSLYTFDMTRSPSVVNRVALIGANGEPKQNSPTLAGRDDRQLAARQSDSDSKSQPLNLDDWPKYDDSFASDEAWNNYAAAQDPDGMVVFARGNEDDPIRMFNARENSWVDASLAFSDQERLGDTSVSSSSSSSSTPTSTSAPTSSAEKAAGDGDDGYTIGSNAILGIVLGSIVGLLLLLGLVLFCLRRKKLRKTQDMTDNGNPTTERGGPDMAGRGPSNASRGNGHGHYPQNSNDSYSSMAILMNKTNQQNRSLGRNPSTGTNRSSMSSIFNKEFKSTISKPIPQSNQYSPPQYSEKELEAGDRTTYFGPSLSKRVPRRPTIGSPTQPEKEPRAGDAGDRLTVFGPSLSQRAPPRPPRGSATLSGPSLRPDAVSADPAERRSSGWNRYWSGGSALNVLGFGGKRATMDSDGGGSRYSDNRVNRVTQDSATVPPLHMETLDGRPELNRVHSGSPTVSQAQTKWPIMKEGMTGKIERPVSQGSGLSGYSSGIPESVYDASDNGETKKPWGADRAPTGAYGDNGYGQPSSLNPSSTSGASHIGVSRQPPLKEAKFSTDMSWLNLGGNRG